MPAVERIGVLFELCWRLELTLLPISTEETDLLVALLEKVNPFGAKLVLPGAEAPDLSKAAETRIGWRALALHIMRTAREDLDIDRFSLWRSRLVLAAEGEQTLLGEIAYEDVQLILNRLAIDELKPALTKWQESANRPLEKLRLAAIYAELGESEIAAPLATQALGTARDGEQTPMSVSLDAWASLLLGMVNWGKDTDKPGWHERVEQAKKHDYNPWETIEGLREKLKSPRVYREPEIQEVAGFDPGTITRSHRFGSSADEAPAWHLLRLVEKAPCPLHAGQMTLVSPVAANAAAWIADSAPFWSFSILLRTNANAAIFDEVFGRETIALLDGKQVDRLFNQASKIVSTEIASRKGDTYHLGYTLRENLLRGSLEMVSRLAIRLNPEQLRELARQVVGWLGKQSVAQMMDLREPIAKVASRLIQSLPESEMTPTVELFLPLPIAGEPDFRFPIVEHYKEPFEWLWRLSAAPPTERIPAWDAIIARLLLHVRSGLPDLRGRAFTRLHYLNSNGWLSEEEKRLFGDAVWATIDPKSGFPVINGYLPLVLLSIPGAADRNVSALLTKYLLEFPLPRWRENGQDTIDFRKIWPTTAWLREIRQVFSHPRLTQSGLSVRSALSQSEIEQLAQKLFRELPEWKAVLASQKWSHAGLLGGEDPGEFVDELCDVLGNVILATIPHGHEIVGAIEQQFRELHLASYSIARGVVGWLYQRPGILPEVTVLLERDLTSGEEMRFLRAIRAVISWQLAAGANTIQGLPDSFVEIVVARILLGTEPRLDAAISCLIELLKTDAEILSPAREDHVLLALERMERETSPQFLKAEYKEQRIGRSKVLSGLDLRRWAGRLARALASARTRRDQAIPDILLRWQTICANDPLPEVRRAWQDDE
jgi:hypothetical protein